MKTHHFVTLSFAVSLYGCSHTLPCEDILEVKKQNQQCKQLQSVITSSKNPQQVLAARNRFEAECENLRYYRNDYDTICKGEQAAIGETKQENTKKKN